MATKEIWRSYIKKGENRAALAMLITASLDLIKGVSGYFCNSSALFADALHSGADVLAISASWVGLRLIQKKATTKFPFGYYKAENLAALFISLLILYAGWEMAKEGYNKLFSISILNYTAIALSISLLSSFVSFILFSMEKNIEKKINSQSLLATADEQKIDALSSLAVFISIGMTYLKVPYVEGIVILIIASFIFKIGYQNGLRAIYGLMDANIYPDLQKEMENYIQNITEVKEVSKLKIRQAGPFIFVEATIRVKKSADIVQAHIISEIVEKRIKEQFPIVVSVIIHIEPYLSSKRRILIPTEEDRGLESKVSTHFGRAPYFAYVDVEGNKILSITFKENFHCHKKNHAGLLAAHTVVKDQIDVLVIQKLGEISFYTLRDHLVEIFLTRGNTLREVIDHYLTNNLKPLNQPTHSSEKEEEIKPVSELLPIVLSEGIRKRRYRWGNPIFWKGEVKNER